MIGPRFAPIVVSIRPASMADVTKVIDRSALSDDPMAPRACKEYWIASVEAWAGCVDDEPACVWGLIAPSLMSESAYLWLITCDLVDEHKFTFVRHSQMVIEKMLSEFSIIRGHAVVGDDRAKRWLKWLGVVFEEPIRGNDGRMILTPFILRRTLRG